MVNPKAFFLRQQALKAKLEPLAITKKKKKKLSGSTMQIISNNLGKRIYACFLLHWKKRLKLRAFTTFLF
jgi:hypothetical protein